MSEEVRFFAAAPRGVADMLAEELRRLGGTQVRARQAGAEFCGSLETGYRACLWSRLASRVLLPLAEFEAPEEKALYAGARAVDWQEHLAPQGTLAVDCQVVQAAIGHSHFAALRVKDAVVDYFRDRCGVRPSVDLEKPDVRLHLYLFRERAALSLDLSGGGLHRRGYREEGGAAPLKENLAAAVLARAGWQEVAGRGGPLVDPLCGSGTLALEAALAAGDVAPGLLRTHYGFVRWRGHRADLWERLLEEARQRRRQGLEGLPPIFASDADPRAVEAARENARRAGLEGRLHIQQGPLSACARPSGPPGLLVCNPPYGERLGEEQALVPLYAELGAVLRARFGGWKAAVLTGNPPLGRHIGLRAVLSNKFANGAIDCRLLRFEVEERYFEAEREERPPAATLSPGAQMLANRLRKNLRVLSRWARRQGVDCYRLYDADLPEYALAVDLYGGERLWVCAQEYQAPSSVDPHRARQRCAEALQVLGQVLEVPAEQVFFKVRRRQRGGAQYEKLGGESRLHEVREGPCRFLVNFADYLDTGLFLDHRLTRALLGEWARGRRFLNLFGYTGAATVHAALGGAASTTTVDLSRTYLDWARRNLRLNGLEDQAHELVQADCLEWLQAPGRRRYGLVFLDPPTFSNSKRMEGSLDLQRDHAVLIRRAAALLEEGGVLVFSTNYRRFKMDEAGLEGLELEEITRQTIPRDFERNPRIHRCWTLRRAAGGSL